MLGESDGCGGSVYARLLFQSVVKSCGQQMQMIPNPRLCRGEVFVVIVERESCSVAASCMKLSKQRQQMKVRSYGD